jgi:ribosomal protein S15P/S13E
MLTATIIPYLDKPRLQSLLASKRASVWRHRVCRLDGHLETIRQDFESRRMLVTMLDVQARLVIEAGQKIAYVRTKLTPDEKRLSIETKITRSPRL